MVKIQGKLFDVFAKMAIQNPNTDVSDLYNQFMQSVKIEDVAFIAGNYAMFLRTAMKARTAPEEIKKEMLHAV